jgi:hypothetical protein
MKYFKWINHSVKLTLWSYSSTYRLKADWDKDVLLICAHFWKVADEKTRKRLNLRKKERIFFRGFNVTAVCTEELTACIKSSLLCISGGPDDVFRGIRISQTKA